MEMNSKYYIASVSCGNDSYCMANLLIENEMPLNEIVFYDTGMEFECIYRLWEILKQKAEQNGIKCTVLHPECPFLTKMLDITVKNRNGSGTHKGYSWCGGRCRWGTTEKLKALDRYCESKNAKVYVGIAADEVHRTPDKPYKLHPLKNLRFSQADCLAYNRTKGFQWLEGDVDLYDILDRVSCWCCGNKNQWELYNIWRFLPQYWEKLKDLQRRNSRPFKSGKYGYTIFEIEARFESGYIPKRRNRRADNATN